VQRGLLPRHFAPRSEISLCVAMLRWRLQGGSGVPSSAHRVPQLLDLYLTSSSGRDFRAQPAGRLRPTSEGDHAADDRERMKIEIDPERLADELAALVAKRLEGQIGTPEPSPWMCMADAITYTGIPAGTVPQVGGRGADPLPRRSAPVVPPRGARCRTRLCPPGGQFRADPPQEY
jgi:hypothetical protein